MDPFKDMERMYQKTGIMECWSNGKMGWAWSNFTQYSDVPVFHHSNNARQA
jgi:hypothetical protein